MIVRYLLASLAPYLYRAEAVLTSPAAAFYISLSLSFLPLYQSVLKALFIFFVYVLLKV
jgi:hypothetical protein